MIQGNIHSHELGGTMAALYTAKRLEETHWPGGLLSRVAFYILPRVNPDGAEKVIEPSGYIRNRRDYRDEQQNTFHQEDSTY